MSRTVALIPARMESSRLPGKPLADICGYPMVIHVAKRASLAKRLDKAVVCTDSVDIVEACCSYGVEVCLTKSKWANGSERIAEAASLLGFDNDDIIVDIQGDEPLITPQAIDDVVCEADHYLARGYDIYLPHVTKCPFGNKNIVKVVSSCERVIYLSRSDVPFQFSQPTDLKKHLSVVVFRGGSLREFAMSSMGALERIESVELLRALENGQQIATSEIEIESFSVDVLEDLERARRYMNRCEIYGTSYGF